MRILNITWTRKRVSFVLVLLPIFLLALVLITCTVNVPYYDQWELLPIIEHIKNGHLYFNDLWHQHNEHRLFFPRIVMLLSAVLTKWNLRAENVISFIIACISFYIVFKILSNTTRALKSKVMLLTPFLLSLIWFSPVQFENWLWGWQIQWFLSVLGIVSVGYGLSCIKDRILSWKHLAYILLGGLVASYSLGNGVIVWPLLIIALLYYRVSFTKAAFAAFTGAVTTGLYYYHYKSPSPSLAMSPAADPVLFVKYVLTYLGRPLSFVHRFTPLFGLATILVFFGLSLFLLLKRRKTFTPLVPWVLFGLYAIGSAMVTAVSRMSLGIGQAYTSRYTTISTLLLISTIVICLESKGIVKGWLKGYYKTAAIISTVLVFGLVLLNVAWGIHGSNIRGNELRNSKVCTHSSQPSDACLMYTFPNKIVVTERLNYIKKIHWGGY